ncbi:methionine--tRNA ligase [Candidatus Aerophobetes bacterium]|uniref:Methionine--tRNA ligase n=1 Tax=Aerophobetes bacterium TaxID=2030807 RepID=A0A2A4X7U0_UNCAE|nr:MAG: methionine--tRNA ligase [Candidatus Aerophobetes bacterium]
MSQEKVLITAALPYANGALHFGHMAGAYLPADVHSRYKRLKGADVLFICGSDEYGVAIVLSAQKAGRSPKEHVDIFHGVNKALFNQLDIAFDHYGRTTCEGHASNAVAFFKDLDENGYIEKKETQQLFDARNNQFLADRYVKGECPKCGYLEARGDECPSCGANFESTDLKKPVSAVSGEGLVLKSTTHWFLRFDLFKDKLKEWIGKKPWKSNVIAFAENYIDELKERAITRDSDWGIPLPIQESEGKVLYVWFDAPIGYISIAQDWAKNVKGDADLWKKYWLDESTRYVQFIGKDNIPFHAIFFPAMVMGQNQPYKLVDDLPANEFLNLEGKKFSKSDNWMIDLDSFVAKFGSDQVRYALIANAPENQDSDFTLEDFQTRVNAELLGKFGNLANRVLVFCQKQFGSVPPPCGKLSDEDKLFLTTIKEIIAKIEQYYCAYELRKAVGAIMELASCGNSYFDSKRPWEGIKKHELTEKMETTLSLCHYLLGVLAMVSIPIIPKTCQKLWSMLGHSDLIQERDWDVVVDYQNHEKPDLGYVEVLFEKIEDEVIAMEKEKLSAILSEAKPVSTVISEPVSLKETIEFPDFTKIDLRVAQILTVEKVKKSKKLLRIEVDLGFEKRQVVSGIALFYPDEQELVGKKVVVVANLKPVKLMGVESQGMILATGSGNAVKVLMAADDAEIGSEVS